MNLVIFDMDGTLIDSSNVIVNTINHVRKEIGLKVMAKSLILENVNDPHINGAEFFYASKKYEKIHFELFEHFYFKNYMDSICLYEGIASMLKNLKDDFRFAVATNATRAIATKMLGHLEIDHFFDFIVGADCVQKSKPHPEMVLKILTQTACHKEKAVLVGDSMKDFMAARDAGIKTLLVNWGFSKHDNGVESIDQLQTILTQGI